MKSILILMCIFIIQCNSKSQGNKVITKNEIISKAIQNKTDGFYDFIPINTSDQDKVIIPNGFNYKVLISYGDKINLIGDTFGFNNDHVEYFPMKDSKEMAKVATGILFVSHEFSENLLGLDRVKKEKYIVGASIFKIKYKNKNWEVDLSSKYNRRITAETLVRVEGLVKELLGSTVTGTLGNCSGGQTPWGTVLSGEESLDYGFRHGWSGFNPKHYGWIIEIDPYDPKSMPVKQTALGRFKHENAAIVISKDGRVVVYMGDDTPFGGFYKFVSDKKYKKDDRKHNLTLLFTGKLYGAKLSDVNSANGSGEWIPLDINDPISGPKLKKAGFKSQPEVLIDVQKASKILGISGLDRPEDCEIHPKDGSIYLALTNNYKKFPPNLHGMIFRFIELNDNHLALSFKYETFAKGGLESGFSSPDNLAFDSKGNLWMSTDISGDLLNTPNWLFHGNNSLFMFNTKGLEKGVAKRFAVGPNGCEMTGLWFSPDEKTLFLSIQHPGEGKNKSTWPSGKLAKPSVITIMKD
ncbi:MAG: DUF839 domain-containing protein [Spirochaetota bacterium]|nr:DUF839 domain-containing protein [Spirochaetota bacterium]